jgi:hypothetical protein
MSIQLLRRLPAFHPLEGIAGRIPGRRHVPVFLCLTWLEEEAIFLENDSLLVTSSY